MPRLLVWQRRQMSPQQVITGPILMEGIERARTGDGGSKKGPVYNGGRLRKKLLCLWRFQAHGLLL